MIPLTPAAIYKIVRDVVIVAAIAFIIYRVYTDGKNAVHAEQLKDLQEQVAEQADTLKQWHSEATDANSQLAQSIGRINSTPVVVHDWVRSQSGCPAAKVLPGAAASTSSGPADGGGDQPVSGASADGSQRDQILADWKRAWETRLATWRAEHAQWPQP